MIAAVATVYNEADIVGDSVRHLLNEGVDHVWVAHGPSTDGTGDILAEFAEVTVVEDRDVFHYQPKWINHLVGVAGAAGAEWIIPFDADEFWYPTEAATLAEALSGIPDTVEKLLVRQFMHRDWDHRYTDYHTLGKVCFRYRPWARVTNGNHDVSLSGGMAGVVDLRELQFRSFDHMARKCHERVDRIDPSLPETDGAHQRVLAVLSPDDLRAEWDRRQEYSVVYDPIPARV